MERFLEDIIKRIYVEKDYDFFTSQCNRKLDFINELENITSKIATTIVEPDSIYDPCIELVCRYESFEKGEFKVSYLSILNISKIVPVFFIQHEFDIINADTNRIETEIGHYSPKPYNKSQDTLHKIVSSFLVGKGYKELSFIEKEEVVPYLKMPDDIRLFGLQMNVEIALFRDLYDINPDEEQEHVV